MIIIICDGIRAGLRWARMIARGPWQVMNNYALLDISAKERERERVSFYFETFGYLVEMKCGTWTEVQVCASDTREEIGL